ncbi:MAG: hypothetical protein HY795_15665 [Desulfovibrio sp.]|nr:hypothetical protein [Desulfovibrio sp.]MBI4958741.1 hypothetical protein [Desulfovibrio sp.]
MGKATFSEKRDYIEFWLWEYTRRALKYDKELAISKTNYFETTIDYFVEECSGDYESDVAFSEPAQQHVVELSKYIVSYYNGVNDVFYDSSDEILIALLSHSFVYRYPIRREESGYKSISCHVSMDTQGDVTESVLIDYRQPLDTVLLEIKHLYSVKNFVLCDRNKREMYREMANEWEFAQSKETSTNFVRVKINNTARAVGVWLWDYVESASIPWKHRAKSYSAFRDKYQNPLNPKLFIQGYASDNQLADLLDKTKECVDKMEILPMG